MIEPLIREFDGTVYGYRCSECGGHWKIYQNSYHQLGCEGEKMTPRTVLAENRWSCFDCDYLGENTVYDPETRSECCPNCGCHDGDGFGMAENDPRHRKNQP